MRMVQATLVAAIAAAVQFASPALLSAEESGRPALMIEIDGAIGPATARYVKEALATAGERRADVVILRLNTPGGLATSMREIIADVLGSSVPVIGYVAPSGAHAASAGTYILYATHIAAMAPGTNLGAATPVQIGGPLPGLPGSAPDKDGKDKKDDAQQPALKDAMTAKATNDAVALIRSLAELRGRNADWAEKAVREAASLSASARIAGECHRSRRARPDRTASADRRPHGRARRWRTRQSGDKGPDDRAARTRLADPAAVRHHRSQRRLHSADGRHLRSDLRVLHPGRHRARRDRHDLPAARPLCPQHAADQLRRPGLDAAGDRASWSSKPSTRPWCSASAALPLFFSGPPCCSRSRLPATSCHGRSSSSRRR